MWTVYVCVCVLQARELVALCEDSVLCSAADMYVQAKQKAGGDGQDLASSLRNVSTTPSPAPDNSHRWSGSNFVKSPTTEPWVSTKWAYYNDDNSSPKQKQKDRFVHYANSYEAQSALQRT